MCGAVIRRCCAVGPNNAECAGPSSGGAVLLGQTGESHVDILWLVSRDSDVGSKPERDSKV
jgi:hypothetical protein